MRDIYTYRDKETARQETTHAGKQARDDTSRDNTCRQAGKHIDRQTDNDKFTHWCIRMVI
jgi:hypothetical protein